MPAVLVSVDAALVYAAFVAAYWVRYTLGLGPHIQDWIAFQAYQPLAPLIFGLMLLVLMVKGAYRVRLGREVVDEFSLIFSASTITVATVVVITSMLREYVYSRAVIVYLWLLLMGFLLLGRWLYRCLQAFCYRRGWGVRRLMVVGGSDVGKLVMQSVVSRPDFGYQLVGFVDHLPTGALRNFGRFRALGTVADIPALIEREGVDDIVIALPASAHEDVWPILALCEHRGVGLKLVPDLFEMSLSRVQVDEVAGIPLLDVQEKPWRRVERAAKRGLDIMVAGAGLVLALPLLVFLGLLIRIESAGPVLLRQERVGLDGRRFQCLKLRTMRHDALDVWHALRAQNELDGPMFKIRNDPRCTPLGRRIRRWSLDELPQLWNVLLGEMSLFGPRPPLPHEVAQYEPKQLRRLEVKPGMTGVWQVSGRNELSFDEMVLMDVYYVDNWSLALDLKVLIRTVVAVAARHGAY